MLPCIINNRQPPTVIVIAIMSFLSFYLSLFLTLSISLCAVWFDSVSRTCLSSFICIRTNVLCTSVFWHALISNTQTHRGPWTSVQITTSHCVYEILQTNSPHTVEEWRWKQKKKKYTIKSKCVHTKCATFHFTNILYSIQK